MSQLQVTGEAKIRDIQGPVVSNSGVITALDGDASQYVRGDGTLADFPTSTGGGSSVSYYLNSSVSQGTIGGVAYRQLGKTPIAGAGTDIVISSNGYVASYLTDANDPALLEVPAGNFNCEFYFSVNNNTGNPFVYAEVYKYDGTTFTLIGTSVGVPEYITEGTVINPYYFAVPVAQSVLTVTDRIAIRIYVNVDGRTVTLHTENNHLCQVVTTFSKGLISLNNLTRQNQFFATGTSGTDFGISSSVATHTFNLPIASATNTGKLSSTDWSTFNNKQNTITNPITGLGNSGNVAYFDGVSSITSENSFNYDASTNRLGVNTTVPNATIGANAGTDSGYSLLLKNDNANYNGIGFGTDSTYGNLISTEKLGTAPARNLTLLNQSGFISITELGNLGVNILNPNTGLDIYNGTSAFLWLHTANSGITGTDGVRLALFSTNTANLRNYEGAFSITAEGDFSIITLGAENFRINSADGSIYQSKVANAMLKSVSGVITAAVAGTDYVVPSDLSAYVTIGTTQTITGTKTFNEAIRNESGLLLKNGVLSGLVGYTSLAGITNGLNVQLSGSSNAQSLIFQSAASYSYTFPASSGTLALASDLSSYVPTSRTLTINGETYDLSANRSWTITGITGSGTSGQVPYFNGPTSLTSEAGFIYDASTNRLGVNTSVPNATIGADAALNSGYGLLIKTGASNYNGIGIAIDSTYGNTIETAKLGTASARNLTLLNQTGFISLTEAGNLGVNILTPNFGIDIYNSTQSQLWLHNAASGLTATDGVRLALFNNLSANLRNFDGGLSLTAEGDFQIITIGAENLRVNSANGFIGIGNPASLPSMLTVNGGATITGLTTGQVLFPTSGGTLSGSSSLFWDNTNAKLGIGTTTLSTSRVTITSPTEANHLHLVSNAPAITFINAISYTRYATVGMATVDNNFITGAVLGDLVLGAYNTNNIWFINNNTNTTRMRLDSDGSGTFSGFVSASGPKSQIRVNGNSVGCGISLTNTIVGANRRNWGIFTEENVEGDFVINRSTTSGGSANTNVLSLSRDGAATFSGNNASNTTENASVSWNDANGNLMGRIVGYRGANGNDGNLRFYTSNTPTLAMTITSGGNVGIGTTSPFSRLHVQNSNVNEGTIALGSNIYPSLIYSSASSGEFRLDNRTSFGGFITFYPNGQGTTLGSEAMRITSGGQIQIGGTTNTFIDFSGTTCRFYGGGSTNTFALGAANAIYYQGDANQFYPTTDNARNLGTAGFRYTTVYATTATINTSDINEKLQIEDLTELEKNVAIKLKGLIKKFKFKDAVILKGDNARIHIGVIAQEVEKAFKEEGLNANEYGLFCSDTWYELDGVTVDKDTEGAIEKTRLGIRYEELVTFIISQI